MRKRLKNMSVRAKLILSFASIVLLTTLAVNISFFSVVEGNYIAEIDRYNQMTLEILVSNLDEQFFEPASIYASEMAANSTIFTEISAIIRKTESASPIQIQRVYELLRGFSYHDMNLFTDVMVYFGDQHFTIANTNGIVYLDIDDKNNPGELWWVEAIRNASTQSLWLYGNINPSVTQQGLIYAVGYPSIHPGSSQMNGFAFQYPENALADFMRRYRQTGTEYYLIGPDGVLLYGDAEAYAAISDRDALETAIASTSREMLNIKLSGVDSILNATKTSFGQFTLIAITPTDFMYEQANALRALLQGIGVITFLLGLLLSFFLTRSLYRPLKEIRLANRDQALSGFEPYNEYDYIGALLDKLNARTSTLEQTLSEQMPLLRNALLEALLTGSSSHQDLSLDRYAEAGMALDMPYFRVIHILLPNEITEALSRQNIESVLFSLMNFVRDESDRSRYTLYCLKNLDLGFTILMNYHVAGVDGSMQRTSLLHTLGAYAMNEFGIEIKCLVSSQVHSIEHIYELDEEVREMHHYLFFLWNRNILYTEEIPAISDGSDEIPQAIMDEIKAQIAGDDIEGVKRAVTALIDACQSGQYPYEHCHNKLMTVMHWAASRFPDQPSLYAQMYQAYLKTKSSESFVSSLMQIVMPNMKKSETAPGRNHLIAQKAADLIRENIHTGISVEGLASQLAISAGHLSKIFREEFGKTPSEFISEERLESSLAYLTETDMHIEEIAEKVGYGSTAYYIKKFRERYGVTPKNYRINHKLDIR